MISRCSAESPARHFRSIALLSFFSSAVAGLSDRSSIAAAASSSNSSSDRRLTAEMALKRAIASNHVDTVERPSPSLTPHVEKYLAYHVFRGSLIANETKDEPKHPHV